MKSIYRIAVHSSAIHSVGYVRSRKILEVEFNTGEIYRYLEVPERVFLDFLRAPSKGRYFQHQIRDRYDFVKVPRAA